MRYVLFLLFLIPGLFAMEDPGQSFKVTNENGEFNFERIDTKGGDSVYICTKSKGIGQSHGVDIYEYFCPHCPGQFHTREELHKHVKSQHRNKW